MMWCRKILLHPSSLIAFYKPSYYKTTQTNTAAAASRVHGTKWISASYKISDFEEVDDKDGFPQRFPCCCRASLIVTILMRMVIHRWKTEEEWLLFSSFDVCICQYFIITNMKEIQQGNLLGERWKVEDRGGVTERGWKGLTGLTSVSSPSSSSWWGLLSWQMHTDK